MMRYPAPLPTAPRIYLGRIPKGYAGTLRTVGHVKQLIREGAKDFYVRQKAIDILLEGGVRPKNYLGEIQALFGWVQRNVRYTKDPYRVEVLHTPRRMLDLRAGDCDDMTILLGSMLEAIGHPVRLVLTGPDVLKPKLFSHIYLEVNHRGRWIPLDATMPHPMGWAPRAVIKQVITIGEEGHDAIRGHRSARPGGGSSGAGLAAGAHSRDSGRGRESERSPGEKPLGPTPAARAVAAKPVAPVEAAIHMATGIDRPAATQYHAQTHLAAPAVGDSAADSGHQYGGAGAGYPAAQTTPTGEGASRGTGAAGRGADAPALRGEASVLPVRAAGNAIVRSPKNALSGYVKDAASLYRWFNRFGPSCVVRVQHQRLIPPVVVQIGELVGLMYRSDKWQRGRPRTYIHLMEDAPRLVSDINGKQLYLVGGSYRVTPRGIEG